MLPQHGSDCFYEACLRLSRQDLWGLSFSGRVMKEFVEKNVAPSSGNCRLVLPRVTIRPAELSCVVGPNGVQVQYAGDAQQQLQWVFEVAQYTCVKSFEVVDPHRILVDAVNFNLLHELTTTLCVDTFWLVSTDVSRLHPAYFRSLLSSFSSLGAVRNSTSTFAAAQISDDILLASAQRGVGLGLSGHTVPVGDLCPVTENAILDFCFSAQFQFRRRYLAVASVDISDEFLHRLVQRLNNVAHLERVRLKLWNMPREQRHLEQYERIQRPQYVLHVNEKTDGIYYVRIKYMEPFVPEYRPFCTMILTTDLQDFLASSPNAD
ncbi:hypothetical protein AAVH_03628 [Aphelenchoides avenae]|nr:hypothetical protein AAVH_03628 [Aphelenchus avenae]